MTSKEGNMVTKGSKPLGE